MACCLQVKDHARQLLEKFVGRPFLDPQQARYGEEGSRMGAGDVEKGLAWLDDRFHVIRYEDDELPSVDWVLDLARAAVLRWAAPFSMSASASAQKVECILCTCSGYLPTLMPSGCLTWCPLLCSRLSVLSEEQCLSTLTLHKLLWPIVLQTPRVLCQPVYIALRLRACPAGMGSGAS